MPNQNQRITVLIGALVIGLAFIAGMWLHAYQNTQGVAQAITVTGSVKRSVTADLAKWTASFTYQADLGNVKETLVRTNAAGERVRAFISALGIGADAITFLPVQTDPRYEQQSNFYGSSQRIVGYNIRQEVRVESADIVKMEQLAKDLTKLVDQGIVADYQRTEYFYTKLADLRPELFAEATKDAKTRAEAIASGTGVRVGALRSARTGVIQVLAPNSLEVSDYGAYDLSTKEKEIVATVNVTFALVR